MAFQKVGLFESRKASPSQKITYSSLGFPQKSKS